MKTQKENDSDVFRVYARIRPLFEKEIIETQKNSIQGCITTNNNTIFLSDPHSTEFYSRKEKYFNFDEVFNEKFDNKMIYNRVIKKLVDKSLQGYNSTALAYGVTGTGKTHTMFGDIRTNNENFNEKHQLYLKDLNNLNYNTDSSRDFEANSDSKNNSKISNNNNQFGICIYAVDYLFKKIQELNCNPKTKSSNNSNNNNNNHNKNNSNKLLQAECSNSMHITSKSLENNQLKSNKNSTNLINDDLKSYSIKLTYLEIYNEQVIDLLSEKGDKSEPLLILEDPIKGICIPEITQYKISEVSQVINLILLGNSRRTMAPTSANQFSSRSHAILEFSIEQINLKTETSMTSKLCLVDLAGSERGGMEKGARREEGANINKSLLALGNCINILSDKNKKNAFVPYRDSKLTRLLKDSLGGNISTIMIACISPCVSTFEETLNTLKYASRARTIQKTVTKNINDFLSGGDFNSYKEVIESLKNEVKQLKDIVKNQNFLLCNKNLELSSKGEISSFDFNNVNNNINASNKNDVIFYNEKKFCINNANFNKINQRYELPCSANEDKMKLDLEEEENRSIIRNIMEDELIKKINQQYFSYQKGTKEYADKLKKFEEKLLVEEEKLEKLKKKLIKLNYEKLTFENFDPPSLNKNSYANINKNYEKDEKYIAIKNYLNNYYHIIYDTLYKNSVENHNLRNKIKQYTKAKLNDFLHKNDESASNDDSDNSEINNSEKENLNKNNEFNSDENPNINLNLEEDKVEKNEIHKSENLQRFVNKELIKNNEFKKEDEEYESKLRSTPNFRLLLPNENNRNIKYIDQNNQAQIKTELEKLQIKLQKNLYLKKKLEKFVINFLSTTQYKGIIDAKLHIYDLQNQKTLIENEKKNYEAKINQITKESENKDALIKSLLKEIEAVKNSKIPEKFKALKNQISYGEKYKTKTLNRRNRSLTKRKVSNKLIQMFNFYELNNDKEKLNKKLYKNEIKNVIINNNEGEIILANIDSSTNNLKNINENMNKNIPNTTYKQNYNIIKEIQNVGSHKKTNSSASHNFNNYQDLHRINLQYKHQRNISKSKTNFLKMKKHINSILVYSNNRVKRIANSTDFQKDFLNIDYKNNKTTYSSKDKSINLHFNNNNNKNKNEVFSSEKKSNYDSEYVYIDLGNDKRIPVVTASLDDSYNINNNDNSFNNQPDGLNNINNHKRKSKSINETDLKSSLNKKDFSKLKEKSIDFSSNPNTGKSNVKRSNLDKKAVEVTKNVVIDLNENHQNKNDDNNLKAIFKGSLSQKKEKQENKHLNLNLIENNKAAPSQEKSKKSGSKSITPMKGKSRRNTIHIDDPKSTKSGNNGFGYIQDFFGKNKNIIDISSNKKDPNLPSKKNQLFNSMKLSNNKYKNKFSENIREKNLQRDIINDIVNTVSNRINSGNSEKSNNPLIKVNKKEKENERNQQENNFIYENENYFNKDLELINNKGNLLRNNIYRAKSDLMDYKKDINNYLDNMLSNPNKTLNGINNGEVFTNDMREREFSNNKLKTASVSPNQKTQNAKLECLRKSNPIRDYISNNNLKSESLLGKLMRPDNIFENEDLISPKNKKQELASRNSFVSFSKKYENLNKNQFKDYQEYRNDILTKIENRNNHLLTIINIENQPKENIVEHNKNNNAKESLEFVSFTDNIYKTKQSEKSINLNSLKENQFIMNSNQTVNFFNKKDSMNNFDEKDKDNNSLVISAVTNNNEMLLNSSEVEILQNVFNIDSLSSNCNYKNGSFNPNINNNFDLFLEDNNFGANNEVLSNNNLNNLKNSSNNFFNNEIAFTTKGFNNNLADNLLRKFDNVNSIQDLKNNSKKLFSVCSSKKDSSKAFEEALNKMKEMTGDNKKSGRKK